MALRAMCIVGIAVAALSAAFLDIGWTTDRASLLQVGVAVIGGFLHVLKNLIVFFAVIAIIALLCFMVNMRMKPVKSVGGKAGKTDVPWSWFSTGICYNSFQNYRVNNIGCNKNNKYSYS